jgi:AcrR family transcriptional regulator
VPKRTPTSAVEIAAQIVKSEGPSALTLKRLASTLGVSRATVIRRCGSLGAIFETLDQRGIDIGPRGDTRKRILDAATTVFGRLGFSGATTDDIAREAKVGVATVYRYFKTKEGVAAELLDTVSPRRALRQLVPSENVEADLEQVAFEMLTGLSDPKRASLVRWVLLETLQGGQFLNRVRALSPLRTLPLLAALFETHMLAGRLPKRDALRLAHTFGSLVMGFGLLGPLLAGVPPVDPQQAARELTQIFLNGTRP